jgi:endo-1,4-beta-xylanase
MKFKKIQNNAVCGVVVALSCVFSLPLDAVSAGLVKSTASSIETLRKRDCTITVLDGANKPMSGVPVSVKQVRHHFGFGAAIPYKILHDSALQKVFLDHFEWAAFENELKWPQTDTSAAGPDYSRADSLLDFCLKNDIKVRAHNLFWNQDTGKLPAWTRHLSTTEFKNAVDARIQNAITHYKGKVDQWDIANEVIHGTQLEDKTGNADIWNYIFNKVRGIDGTVKLAINDFNIIEKYSDADKYIAKIKTINNIDIIGLEGHFGADLVQSDYKSKLDKMAGVGKPLWLTEVDFEVGDAANGLKTLLETAFANSKAEGIILWVFWKGNLWRDKLTSYIADSNYAINNTGKQWETTLKGWTTTASGTTDASGKYTFKGFHGKYAVTVNNKSKADTVYLEPGSGAKTISLGGISGVFPSDQSGLYRVRLQLNGKEIALDRPLTEGGPLFVSAYSLSGRLLSKQPVSIANGCGVYQTNDPGCSIYKIGTAKGNDITVKGISLR